MLATLTCALALQTTWFVDSSAAPGGTGTALDPYDRIQTAIDAGSTLDGDTILVAGGTYPEVVVLDGRALTLQLQAGTGDAVVAPTIDGQVPLTVRHTATGRVVIQDIDFQAPRSGRVGVVSAGALDLIDAHMSGTVQTSFGSVSPGLLVDSGADVELSGCTLTRLNFNGLEPVPLRWQGAALHVTASTARLRGCVLETNGASSTVPPLRGGGIYVDADADVTLERCLLQNNSAHSGGGVFSLADSFAAFETEFRGNGNPNSAQSGGGF